MQKKPLSVYIHIPFCEKKCAYCNFVSFDTCGKNEIDNYVASLCKEIEFRGAECENYKVETIFLGGGTPSILDVTQITRIFEHLRLSFAISKNAEITIECNPSSLTFEKLECYRTLGINRISLGVQSTHEPTLEILGRKQTRKQIFDAFENIEKAGFDNVSADFMIGVPIPARDWSYSDIRNLIYDIGEIMVRTNDINGKPSRTIKHISVYTLSIEEGTRLESAIRFGQLFETEDQDWLQEMNDLNFMINCTPFKRYEVSNYAIPGFECKHNQVYWNPQKDYLGLGLAAHSLMGSRRFQNGTNLHDYVNNNSPMVPFATFPQRSNTEVINETIMLGLRTARGLSLSELAALGHNLKEQRAKEIEMLKKLKLIRISKNRLAATKSGFNLLNQIIEKLAL